MAVADKYYQQVAERKKVLKTLFGEEVCDDEKELASSVGEVRADLISRHGVRRKPELEKAGINSILESGFCARGKGRDAGDPGR